MNEAQRLNKMFEMGMDILHLRKPTYSRNEQRALLDEINPEYYNKIVIHNSHDLCAEYGLKGIHIKEETRRTFGHKLERYVSGFKGQGHVVSSSFHKTEDITACSTEFDYIFLSPVFNSISKIDYPGKGFNVEGMEENIIALGGIDAKKMEEVKDMGYNGAAVLGSIWDTDDQLKSFAAILRASQFV